MILCYHKRVITVRFQSSSSSGFLDDHGHRNYWMNMPDCLEKELSSSLSKVDCEVCACPASR